MPINQFPLNGNFKKLNEVIKTQNPNGKIQTSSLHRSPTNSTKPVNDSSNKSKEGK